ncbi:MAG TPA: hypothetical protein VJU15_08165 [Gemmatimonadales bacterium]|nr:hypothetical protein [Gemmatimonadales bacterium]
MIGVLATLTMLWSGPGSARPLQVDPPPVRVLIVTGVSGEPRFAQEFTSQAQSIMTSLGKAGVANDRITWLAEREGAQVAGRATKERVEQELVRLAGGDAGEQALIIFIGHGSDAGEPKLNLPGPDLTAADLARVLSGYGSRPVAVVVAASSSGGFAEKLAAPGRLIITATRTGQERNEVRFGHWFAEAFAGGAADIDKDGALSLLEAYVYTVREVKREYESDNRLQTEHARITDSTLARQFEFGAAAGTPTDAGSQELVAKKRDLETRIAALRARKSQMDPTAYEKQLEALLVELATVNQELRKP